jgi:hypothetical protein
MKLRTPLRWSSLVCLAGLVAGSVNSASAQSFYVVSKTQVFTQTAASGAVADPLAPFVFGAEAATNAALTLPAGTVIALQVHVGGNETNYRLEQAFTTKAALDTAFPNGTYRITGAGLATLNFNLTTEGYPTATPSVTNGTWTNGVLVVNPTVANTVNFSPNSSYGTGGVPSHMSFSFNSTTDQSIDVNQEIVSQAAFGLPVQTTPFTSYTIAANTLTNGRVYQAELDYDALSTLDSTSVPGGGVVSIWQKALQFYIVTQTPGTPTPPAPATPVLANVSGVAGGSVTINAGTVSGNNTAVDWFFNGQRLNAGNTSTKYTYNNFPGLTINNLSAADVGSYQMRIVTAGGLAISNTAALSLAAAAAPVFTAQPSTQTVTVTTGSTVVFSAAATGVPTPTYQWQRDNQDIPGATSATLVLSGTTGTNAAIAGSYRVIASNSAGKPPSTATPLNIISASSDPGRLINLSILTGLNAGESMTMGTVLGGANTNGSKALLARAAGPSLVPLGVNGVLPDPTMTLNFTSPSPVVVVATNNDWAGTTTLSNAFSAVGAFGYVNATSKDAAILSSSLAPGNYTVDVKDSGSGTGTVIAELYDSSGSSYNNSTPRLINVSVLKQISAGSSLTAGFVIGGSTAKTVLVRAVGPTLGLAPFGIGGVMPDPQLKLFAAGGVQIAANDDWGGDPQIANAIQRVGAFALNSTSTKDAVLLITLPAGGANYTATVSPVSGGGIVIVEVYEVP